MGNLRPARSEPMVRLQPHRREGSPRPARGRCRRRVAPTACGTVGPALAGISSLASLARIVARPATRERACALHPPGPPVGCVTGRPTWIASRTRRSWLVSRARLRGRLHGRDFVDSCTGATCVDGVARATRVAGGAHTIRVARRCDIKKVRGLPPSDRLVSTRSVRGRSGTPRRPSPS